MTICPEYDQIHQEMADVHWKWQNFNEMFADQAHFELLNKRLPGFGVLAHNTLLDAVVLGICRLLDPAESFGKPNLTFDQLKSKATTDPSRLAWLETEIGKAKAAAANLKTHRNKRIAHLDLTNALGPTMVLPNLSRNDIDDVLALLRGVMNGIGEWSNEPERGYDVLSFGDADQLIWCIQQANRLCELQDDAHCQRLDQQQIVDKLKIRPFAAKRG